MSSSSERHYHSKRTGILNVMSCFDFSRLSVFEIILLWVLVLCKSNACNLPCIITGPDHWRNCVSRLCSRRLSPSRCLQDENDFSQSFGLWRRYASEWFFLVMKCSSWWPWFLAHIHHAFETYHRYGRTATAAKRTIMSTGTHDRSISSEWD